MNVRSFKLTTGEELVAQLVSESRPDAGILYTVKNPLIVHYVRSENGPTLAFAQYSLVHKEDQEITIFASGLVAAPIEVIDEVARSYMEQTTGLALPPVNGGKILLG